MSAATPRGERAIVPDVLRGIAIVAMLIAHAVPAWRTAPRPIMFLMGNINDLASPLFALVMGMSALLLQNRTPAGQRGRLILQQWLRGVILIALGLWMVTWGTWVVIVLQYLGVLLIVGAPILLLRSRWVAVVALITVLISDPLNAWARTNLTEPSPLSPLFNWVTLGGSYRLTNLLPFFLLGALLAHQGFRRNRTMWTMLAIAPVAYLVRPLGERLLQWPDSVSGSYPDTLHDVGLVFLTYVVVVLLSQIKAQRWRRGLDAVFTFLRAEGQLALSLYLFHVSLLWLWDSADWHRYPVDPALWLTLVVGVPVVGWLWWRYIGTGPVEWVMGAATGRRKPLRTPN